MTQVDATALRRTIPEVVGILVRRGADFASAEDAVQAALFEIGGRPPALVTAYETAAAADPDVAALGEIAATGVPMPAIPAMGSVWADWGNAELSLIKGEGDPTEVWTTAVDNIEAKIAG